MDDEYFVARVKQPWADEARQRAAYSGSGLDQWAHTSLTKVIPMNSRNRGHGNPINKYQIYNLSV